MNYRYEEQPTKISSEIWKGIVAALFTGLCLLLILESDGFASVGLAIVIVAGFLAFLYQIKEIYGRKEHLAFVEISESGIVSRDLKGGGIISISRDKIEFIVVGSQYFSVGLKGKEKFQQVSTFSDAEYEKILESLKFHFNTVPIKENRDFDD